MPAKSNGLADTLCLSRIGDRRYGRVPVPNRLRGEHGPYLRNALGTMDIREARKRRREFLHVAKAKIAATERRPGVLSRKMMVQIRRSAIGTTYGPDASRERPHDRGGPSSDTTIQHSEASIRALASRHGINPKTVAKWKRRTSPFRAWPPDPAGSARPPSSPSRSPPPISSASRNGWRGRRRERPGAANPPRPPRRVRPVELQPSRRVRTVFQQPVSASSAPWRAASRRAWAPSWSATIPQASPTSPPPCA